MTPALILLGALLALGALCLAHQLLTRHKTQNAQAPSSPPAEQPSADGDDDACCGQHAVCVKRRPLPPQIIYYDDEELDCYAGRPADAYTEAETEQFRRVLMTMRADDAPGWAQSLQMRGIAVPDGLRDELLLFLQ